MRAIVPFGVLALLALIEPASAQMMCGPAQQAQAPGAQGQYTPAQGGMMCGAGTAAQDDPMADKPTQPQQGMGMCPCCRNMAMMRGGMGGMMGQQPAPQQQQNMPGMPQQR